MARKDVDLVIRAKDEAEKVVKSITAAINDFTEAQKNLTTKSGKTETSIQALGSAFGKFQKDLKGGSAADLIAASLDKANNAVERLDKTVTTTRKEVKKLGADFRDSSQGVEVLRDKVAKAAKALLSGQSALKKYKVDLSGAKKEATALAQAEKKLAVAGMETRLRAKGEAAAKTKTRIAELRAQISAMDKPTKRLSTSLETNTNKLSRQQTEVAKLSGALEKAKAKQVTLAAKMVETAAKIEGSTSAIKRQEAVVAGLGADYTRVAKETKAAEVANANLGKAVAKTNQVLARQDDQLNKAQVELKQFASTSKQASVAMRALSAASAKGLKLEIGKQVRAAKTAKSEFSALAKESNALASAIGRVGVPTRKMIQDFQRVKIQSGAAKSEFLAQRDTLGRLRQAYREAGSDVNALASAQLRFVAIQGQAGTAIQGIRAKTDQAVGSLNKLHAGYQRTATASSVLAQKSRSNASAQTRELTVSEQLARAYRNLYGEKRRALSLTQRLRGEVLSMVAAYGGLYGVISILRQTVDAYTKVEAAQARLNVAFDGSPTVVAAEMDFLRRNAARLGVEFGALAGEYSKFAIATKNTALEGDVARRLFLQIAEAARVNRSSMDEMKGVFVAVTQIVNKGAVQMEELRQQLGDRLPGAIQLMADGLGVGTAELVKMMEQGQITAEALIPFGNELEKRFGPQLAESLQATSAEMGRLQNAAFQALTTFGQAGFIDSFTSLMRTLSETLQSADAEAFLSRLSVAFGGLLDVVGYLAENFQIVTALIGAFLGVKLLPAVLAIGTGFRKLNTSLGATRAQMTATQVRAASMGASVSTTSIAVRGLTTAFKGLLSSTGVGLAFVAISTAIGFWATEADRATESMNLHQDIVARVRDAYDAAAGASENWAKTITRVSALQAGASVKDLQEQLVAARREATVEALGYKNPQYYAFQVAGLEETRDKLHELAQQFRDGAISIDGYKSALSELARVDPTLNTDHIVALQGQADGVRGLADATHEAELVLIALTGTNEEATAALYELRFGVAQASAALEDGARDGVERFSEAMAALRDTLPDATAGMSKLEKETLKIDNALQQALVAARALPDAIMRIAAEQHALAAANQGLMDLRFRAAEDGFSSSLVDRIITVESGGDPTAQNANSSATGLGQFIGSTWLRMFRENFPDRAEGLTRAAILELRKNADVSRQMVQLYLNENAKHLRSAGIAITDANLYLAHFLGPGGAQALINSAPGTEANDVLSSGQVSANASILDGKTREEVIAWAQRKVGISEQELQMAEAVLESERDRLGNAADFHAQTEANIEQQQFELSIADQDLIMKEQAKAIREAELAAQKAGTALTSTERETILANIASKYRQQAIDEATADAEERRADAESRINDLLDYRDSIKTQLDAANDNSDTDKAEELRAKIEEINGQLEAAIANATAMWGAVGGEQGDAAVARLEALRIRAAEFGQAAEQAYFSWAKVGELLMGGLATAFDTFAKGVAEGKSATEAARDAFLAFAGDFLRQIAQMIIKQAIFNALKGTSLGGLLGIGVAHAGGRIGSKRAGSGNAGRKVNPAIFNGAMRFHKGGIPGLRPGEVPIIAKENEEVLTRDDPRHVLNGGKSGGKSGSTNVLKAKIINAIDAPSFLEAALNSPAGEQVFLNFIRANSDAVSGANF